MSLSVRNLYKYYGKQEAVKDLDLTFEAGRIYGLLGRNGAGKSTILKLLASQLTKSAGQIVLDGEDIGFSQDTS
ncbi:ATP-binding cassette domain-containing protein [Streptococcus caprae]|uniref:ATP-binding cassette domain-containing protein n=1 Tax=Streptococcus caprae TaxID=1640501 RepID=A0ABV8CX94_9STRE